MEAVSERPEDELDDYDCDHGTMTKGHETAGHEGSFGTTSCHMSRSLASIINK